MYLTRCDYTHDTAAKDAFKSSYLNMDMFSCLLKQVHEKQITPKINKNEKKQI